VSSQAQYKMPLRTPVGHTEAFVSWFFDGQEQTHFTKNGSVLDQDLSVEQYVLMIFLFS
jgi:hypothetical protein